MRAINIAGAMRSNKFMALLERALVVGVQGNVAPQSGYALDDF
jgi:hypothetical protein